MKNLIIKGTPNEVCYKIETLGIECKNRGLEPTVLNMLEVSNA